MLLRVAVNNGVVIPTECKDGMCGSCAVRVEEIGTAPDSDDTQSKIDPDGWDKNKYTTYMEDKELNTLVEMGAISKLEAESAQQYAQQTPVRLACQCIIKGPLLVKPFE
ncbi:2Fe-2S iron-sulfur cluster binding domain-containing protein [bacterium]|nr:2Fe-2S iron-sulfur cluster binding domain-containing protein [bacterium]MBU1990215.1 2Fe-2S iron-sulfur cluster binding domain-containing protein [bacterium]